MGPFIREKISRVLIKSRLIQNANTLVKFLLSRDLFWHSKNLCSYVSRDQRWTMNKLTIYTSVFVT